MGSVPAEKQQTLYCSFCGKSQYEVKKLIAGPTVFICEECVDMCVDIVHEELHRRIFEWTFFSTVPGFSATILTDRLKLSASDLFELVFGQKPALELDVPEKPSQLLLRFAEVLQPHLIKAYTAEELAAAEERARTELEAFDAQVSEKRKALVGAHHLILDMARQHAES